MPTIKLHTFQYGSPRKRGEGLRIGTARYLPRGVFKADYATLDYFDVWLPVLAPSRELLRWGKDAAKSPSDEAWANKYANEMKQTGARQTINLLAELAKTTPIAIGCYCVDESKCHRALLHSMIMNMATENAQLVRKRQAPISAAGGVANKR